MVIANVGAALIALAVTLAALIGRRIAGAVPLALTAFAVTVWSICAAINAAYRGPGGYRLDWLNYGVWLTAVPLGALGLVVLERRLSHGTWRLPRWLAVTAAVDAMTMLVLTNPLHDLRVLGFRDSAGSWHHTILWAAQALYVFVLLFVACAGLVRQAGESHGVRQMLLYAATGAAATGIALQAAQIQAMALCGALTIACVAGVVLGTRAVGDAGRSAAAVPPEVHAAKLEQALRDPVTGLIGRVALGEVLDDLGTEDQFAVILIDLDGLKPTNDTYGHLAGDELLRVTASRIAAAVGGVGTVGRFGGDEFVAALPGVAREYATTIAATIVAEVRSDCPVGPITLTPTVSVGVACGTLGDEVARVLNDADGAMYGAKRLGGDRFCVAELAD